MTHSDSILPELASQAPLSGSGNVAAIVVAAGRGQRFGAAENKVLLPLCGRPVWVRSVEALRRCSSIGSIVVVARSCDLEAMNEQAAAIGVWVAEGGKERVDSVRAGLDHLAAMGDGSKWVAIHDAARPLVTASDIQAVVEAAIRTGAAILASPVRGTIKRGKDDGSPIATMDRRDLWEAMTPQVFERSVLLNAFARHRGRPVTDDAELVERTGTAVCLVPGSADNLKITQPEDLWVAEAIFSRRMNEHV